MRSNEDVACTRTQRRTRVSPPRPFLSLFPPSPCLYVYTQNGICVCFGPSKGGPTTVKIIGSSVESMKAKTRRASKDLWDDDNNAGLSDKPAGGVGSAELFSS